MARLLEELKRRNIFRVATVYAVASWVILQLADITFPALDIPEADIRYVIIALAVLFPIVLIFSWAFQVTPEGLKRTRPAEAEADADSSTTSQTARRIDFVIIGLLSVALLFFMGEYFTSSNETELVISADEAPAVKDEDPLSLPNPIVKPSIAVLPLVNMSSDIENEHFSDGLTEELLNVLARNPQLRVAGRTSSFFYKGKNVNLQEIGESLNVTNILEGSVRKSGDTIRITAQLINAETGFHIWSETYDRKITDIFVVQDEIANRVAEAMDIALLSDEVFTPGATTDIPEAHDLHLQAKALLYDRRQASIEQAIEMFERASELDRNYGPPLVALAEAIMVLENNFFTLQLTEASELAKNALDRAAAIGYTPSEYWSTLGLYHDHLQIIDPAEAVLAESAYQRALELNDNNISAYLWYASLLSESTYATKEVSSINHLEQAIQLNQMALKLDPKNRVANGNYNINLMDNGQLALAVENLEQLVIKDPDYLQYKALLATAYFVQGNFSESTRWLAEGDSASARTTFGALQLFQSLDNDQLWARFFDNLKPENPLYERMRVFESALSMTKAELVGQAQVALLQPDFDRWSWPIARALYAHREFGWSKKLQENMNLEWANETPRFRINSRDVVNYISASYLAGDTERATLLATHALKNNRDRLRLAPRGKQVEDAAYYMVLKRPEEAITEIESAFRDGYRHFYQHVYENPIFDPIASDPRMNEIKRKTDLHISQHIEAIERNLILVGVITPIASATDI